MKPQPASRSSQAMYRVLVTMVSLMLLLGGIGPSQALLGSKATAQAATLPVGTFLAFGPRDYVRTSGGPSIFTTRFSLLNPQTTYKLRIFNGGQNSDFEPIFDPISSAVITLNGAQVAGPSDFTKQVSLLEKPVTALASNEMVVELRSAAGAGLTIQLIGVDTDMPVIGEIVEPRANSAGWHNGDVAVSFLCKDATSSIASCTGPATLTAEGAGQVVTGTTTDSAGNSATASVTINIDRAPPALGATLSPPASQHGWHNDAVTVSFAASDALSGVASVSAPVTVSGEGAAQPVSGAATDLAGNTASGYLDINLDLSAPSISELQPAEGSTLATARPIMSASFTDALSGVDPIAAQVTLDGVDVTAQAQLSPAGFSVVPAEDLANGSHVLAAVIHDLAGNSAIATTSFTVQVADDGLPPDPVSVAPALDRSVATDLVKSSEFLYTGENPIQTDVVTGTIELARGAVLRGRVLQRDGSALTGVTITIQDHPEYGQTLSRADGAFDLAVNGGAVLVVNYEKAGFLPAQRQVDVPWQSFAFPDDVILIPLDSEVTTIDLGAPDAIQIAQGSPVSDGDGTRQATLLFPQGTQAEMVLPDGSTQALTTLNVRATEYTVGERGLEAMPGNLPGLSGYTYAAEFSVDEAIAAGAAEVRFSQPVIFYLENFLGFPTGGIVPTGYYDRARAAWVPSQNGTVIQVVGISGGLADVDTDGDGQADSGAALGITAAERAQIATLYAPGQSLWRVPFTHFTPWDCNWPYGPPLDAEPPLPVQCMGPGAPASCGQLQPERQQDKPEDDPCESLGSIIECQNQTLRERLRIGGTPFSLNYASDRTPARATRTTIEIPVSPPSVPASLKRIELEIAVAGQVTLETFPAEPNLTYTFVWNGRDAYGRVLQGTFPVLIRHKHVYDAVYLEPASFSQSFGRASATGAILNATRGANVIKLESVYVDHVSQWDARGLGLGGWTLSEHHIYNDAGQLLYRGDGTRASAGGVTTEFSVNRVAGTGAPALELISGPATTTPLRESFGVAVSPDGMVYISEAVGLIRRITPDGNLEVVAGGGQNGGSFGDGGPARNATLRPRNITFDAQGNLYIADSGHHCVRKIDTGGIINTIAGRCGQGGSGGDGGPATQARLNFPRGIAVGPDGSVYIADNNQRVRQVGPDGIITTVAGTGVAGFSGDGGPAVQAQLNNPFGLTVGPDGSTLYIADSSNHRIRAVRSDGTIATVVGTGAVGFSGDGGPAALAKLNAPSAIVVDRNGSLYIADNLNLRIRRVAANGHITTVAGSNGAGFFGDGGPALAARFRQVHAIAAGQDGRLVIADGFNNVVRGLQPTLPDFLTGDLLLPSEDESELYEFDSTGRHLRTLDGLSGALRWTFGYDERGLLVTVSDANGNVTTIERDAAGNPTAIIAPFGQRTALGVDAAGQLITLTDPAGQAYGFTYHGGNLLASMTDPRGAVYRFAYDAAGRLTRDTDPLGGFTALDSTATDNAYTVTRSTGEGRVTTFAVEALPNGDLRRTTTSPTGGVSSAITRPEGTQQLTIADGSLVTLSFRSDPRWGLLALTSPVTTIRLPSGLSHTSMSQRSITLADPHNPLSVQLLTDTLTINGRAYTGAYNALTRTLTSTSPEGRRMASALDEQGRVVEATLDPALAPSVYAYDERGRLERRQQDGLSLTYAYDGRGRVASITDAAGNSVRYEYDNADRVTRKIMPSQRAFQYGYDANGNLTSVTLPSGAVHQIGHTPLNLQASYTAPGAGSATRAYNLERGLDLLTLAGGRAVDYSYDGGGRITGLAYPEANVTFAYGDATERVQAISRTPASGQAQSIAYGYDGFLVTSAEWDGAVDGTFGYTYNNNFFLTSLSLDGSSLSIARDNDGLVTGYGPFTIGRGGPAGAQSRITDGALAIDLAYDPLARLDTRTHTVGGQAAYALDLDYESAGLGGAGRVQRRVETVAGTTHTYTYTYDLDGQLAAVHRDGSLVEGYAYDTDGNRTSTLAGAAQYDSRGMLSQLGAVAYQFDADGFLARRGSDTFEYSARGELLRATLGSGETISYAYDGVGRRIARTDSAGTIQYLYGDPGNAFRLTHMRDRAGSMITLFYDEADALFAFEQGGARFYVATDQVGTPKVVTDASGAVFKQLEYDSFGVLISDSNPALELAIGYAGGLADPATGLVRFGWRDYDPAVGRWTAHDPILFDGGQDNLYVYVGNDPVNLRDPMGLFCVGGSLYTLVGGGAEVCFNEEGFSVCGEIGFGAGGGFGVASGDPRRNGSQITAEAQAGCAGYGIKAGVALKDCGEFEADAEGSIGPFKFGPAKVGLEHDGTKVKLGNTGCSLGGKLAAKICGGF